MEKMYKLSASTVRGRLHNGWSNERAEGVICLPKRKIGYIYHSSEYKAKYINSITITDSCGGYTVTRCECCCGNTFIESSSSIYYDSHCGCQELGHSPERARGVLAMERDVKYMDWSREHKEETTLGKYKVWKAKMARKGEANETS